VRSSIIIRRIFVPIDAIRPGENLAEELYALDMSSASSCAKRSSIPLP
jgi:hypothetical protein